MRRGGRPFLAAEGLARRLAVARAVLRLQVVAPAAAGLVRLRLVRLLCRLGRLYLSVADSICFELGC